jgi:hypothetical protein
MEELWRISPVPFFALIQGKDTSISLRVSFMPSDFGIEFAHKSTGGSMKIALRMFGLLASTLCLQVAAFADVGSGCKSDCIDYAGLREEQSYKVLKEIPLSPDKPTYFLKGGMISESRLSPQQGEQYCAVWASHNSETQKDLIVKVGTYKVVDLSWRVNAVFMDGPQNAGIVVFCSQVPATGEIDDIYGITAATAIATHLKGYLEAE